jgi:glutathione S-transferase
LFRPFRKVDSEVIALYEKQHSDASLVAFLRDFAEAGPAWQARVEEAQRELAISLGTLESTLAESQWLSGPDYGLADISWVVNANRLQQAQVDLTGWPHFQDWAQRAIARPAFDRAVASYRP